MRARLWIFLGLFLLMALLTCLAVSSSLKDGRSELPGHTLGSLALGAAAPMLGPFQGGFSRHWQACCTANSWSLFPWAGCALALGLALQFVPLPAGRSWERGRLVAWSAGWLVWFGAGLLSLGHALE